MTTIDRLIAFFALVLFIGFLGILVVFVPHVDLFIVLAVCASMACYDFWRELFHRKAKSSDT